MCYDYLGQPHCYLFKASVCKLISWGWEWNNLVCSLVQSKRSRMYTVKLIENTSWKVLTYGICTRVVFVSEIERVSAANEWDFWCKNNEWVNTVQSTLHVVLCLLYTYWDILHFGGLFILNLSKMLKFAATHHEITVKTKNQLFSRNVS